jgi:tRNA modification GTPase
LARAATRRTAGILLDQWYGAFDLALDAIDRSLAEDDRHGARALLSDILGRAPLGRHLTRPWRVAVAGAPNVGKSSLVNALAGYQRSVVMPTPGTTRDVVLTVLAVDGWPVELLDTAGQHSAADRLEVQGIARARSVAATADLCLWVVDVTAAPVWPDTESPNLLRILNKTDRPSVWDTAAVADAVSVSALAGVGLDHLCERISRRLVPEPPQPGAAVPFADDIIIRLEEYVQALGTISAAEGRVRLAAFRGRPAAPLPPA